MDLTDEQWALIQHLIPPPSPYSRGRPPADPRAVLNGIFRKFRLAAPWYNLPPTALGDCPSWQTCYRAYRRWKNVGILDEIFKLLDQHLLDQGGFDFRISIWFTYPSRDACPVRAIDYANASDSGHNEASNAAAHTGSGNSNPNPDQSAITVIVSKSGWQVHISPDLENTWQGATALLLTQNLLLEVKSRLKLAL